MQWASQLEVWGHYGLTDGDMVQGWYSGAKWDWRQLDFKAKVHGDGLSSEDVWISARSKPVGSFNDKHGCMVVPQSNVYRNLRNEIAKGVACPQLLANMRAKPKEHLPLSDCESGSFTTWCNANA